MTFHQAAEKYMELKSNVLSPRTIKEYADTPARLSSHFCSMLISDITQQDIQKEINSLAKDKSPKTVRNYHGFITAILGTYRPDLKISTTLPQQVRSSIPSCRIAQPLSVHHQAFRAGHLHKFIRSFRFLILPA